MGSSPFPHHRLGHVPVQISPLEESHLPQLMQVQKQAYAGLPVLEPVEFFRNRRQLAPQGCLVALAGHRVAGYLVSYPWDDGLPPALGELLDALPEPGRHWFVHDCAVSPEWHGRGIAQRLLAATVAAARRQGLSSLRLVSLAGAVRFWQRHGFQDVTPTPRLQTKLAGYGAGARLMQRRILAEPSPSA